MRIPIPLLLVALLATAAQAGEPEIRLVQKDKSPIAVEAVGLTDAGEAKLELFVVSQGAGENPPAVLGTSRFDSGVLRFTPQYSLRPGMTYRAVLSLPGGASLVREVDVPAAPRGKPAQVTAIYPSAEVLPENQLRFYLHFSAPMSRGEAYPHLALLKASGAAVEVPFLEIGEELWDASGQRLTLLIDPGRIKRGLKPREEDGPVLAAGNAYALVVRAGWKDAAGEPLAEEFRKEFAAGPPVESAIDQTAWKIAPPRAGSRQPLAVTFDRPLDRALILRTIELIGPNGRPVAGQAKVAAEERGWHFVPGRPWTEGDHELTIDTTLEDQAGNRIGRPFEVDQFEAVDKTISAEFVRLAVPIRAAAK